MQHFLSDFDLTSDSIMTLLDLGLAVKRDPERYRHALSGKSIATVYEKPSLRTRVSFDVGIQKLGGHAIYLDQQNGALGKRESVKEFAQNLSCWVDGIVARVFDHHTLQTMAEFGKVPVVNSLCNLYHPCQALADYLSLYEVFGKLKGLKLGYIGDGNNVTHSLLIQGALLGVDVVVVAPSGHSVDAEIWDHAKDIARATGTTLSLSHHLSALNGVDVLYTDSWLSMGDPTPLAQIKDKFDPYQLDAELMAQTGAKYAMHCQPAHRDLEISSEVMDGPQSLLLRQAENRMYAQNAILITLLNPQLAKA